MTGMLENVKRDIRPFQNLDLNIPQSGTLIRIAPRNGRLTFRLIAKVVVLEGYSFKITCSSLDNFRFTENCTLFQKTCNFTKTFLGKLEPLRTYVKDFILWRIFLIVKESLKWYLITKLKYLFGCLFHFLYHISQVVINFYSIPFNRVSGFMSVSQDWFRFHAW